MGVFGPTGHMTSPNDLATRHWRGHVTAHMTSPLAMASSPLHVMPLRPIRPSTRHSRSPLAMARSCHRVPYGLLQGTRPRHGEVMRPYGSPLALATRHGDVMPLRPIRPSDSPPLAMASRSHVMNCPYSLVPEKFLLVLRPSQSKEKQVTDEKKQKWRAFVSSSSSTS